MNRKKLYRILAGLLLFFLVFLLAKRGLFQNEPISSRSGKDIYETLMSLRPGTSIERVQEILGKPIICLIGFMWTGREKLAQLLAS